MLIINNAHIEISIILDSKQYFRHLIDKFHNPLILALIIINNFLYYSISFNNYKKNIILTVQIIHNV